MKTKEKDLILKAEKREMATRGAVNALRRQGRVPGIVYGDKGDAMPLSVDEKSLQQIIHSERGRNTLITLEVANTTHPVLLKEIQRNAITRAILHVDFHRVSLKEKVETSVRVHVIGEAPGVKLSGGVLEHVVREVRVRCLPTDIPSSFDTDVSTLQIGQSVRAKELKIPEGVELLIDPESIVINIVSPTILEEPTVAATATEIASTEPEVIKKGKIEEGEEGAAPAAGAEKKPAAGAEKKPAASAPPAKADAKKPEGK